MIPESSKSVTIAPAPPVAIARLAGAPSYGKRTSRVRQRIGSAPLGCANASQTRGRRSAPGAGPYAQRRRGDRMYAIKSSVSPLLRCRSGIRSCGVRRNTRRARPEISRFAAIEAKLGAPVAVPSVPPCTTWQVAHQASASFRPATGSPKSCPMAGAGAADPKAMKAKTIKAKAGASKANRRHIEDIEWNILLM